MIDMKIEEKIEQLSLEFVLADHTDLDSLAIVITHFEEIGKWALEFSFKMIAEESKAAVERIKKILDNKDSNPEITVEELSNKISAIQNAVRTGEDLIDTGHLQMEETIGGIEVKKESINEAEKTEDQEKPETDQTQSGQEKSQEIGVKHPESLPAHLDEALFAEFLSLQDNVLDEMEALILEIENNTDVAKFSTLKRLFHTLKGEAGFLNLAEMETLCHKTEDIFDAGKAEELVDILLSVVDWLRKAITGYSGRGDMPESTDQLLSTIGERNDEFSADNDDDEIKIVSNRVKTENEIDPEGSSDGQDQNESTEIVQDKSRSGKAHTKIKEFVNIDAKRLDKMVNTIGELAIAESMVRQSDEISEFASTTLLRHIGHLGKITRELQEMGLSLRMVPIRGTFQKMGRIIRDIAKKSNKDVRFELYGEDTELDKTVVDKIGDPLMHIVRNAVDHGIENSAKERIDAGKNETAVVEMHAFHKGGNIYIEVVDDGGGIDSDAILKKAIEKGIVDENTVIPEEEIIELIFAHGFSTAAVVTDVSGRGVGMDVVRTNIEALHGQIKIRTTKGKGSVFSIRIPLTLAIIDGMIVRVGKERYIIPTLSIVTSKKFSKEEITSVHQKGEMVTIQRELIPLLRLDLLFNIEEMEGEHDTPIIVIVEDDGQKTGLLVDAILGKQQIVIKSLGASMKNISGISGGAIMSDGKVGLILDVGGIVKLGQDKYYCKEDTPCLKNKKEF